MIKSLVKIALVLIVGLLVYNYFFGDEAEKATSKKVYEEIKDVGVAVKDFVKDEHKRIKEGKYSKVMDKIDEALTGFEAKMKDMDPETIAEYKKLKRESDDLDSEIDEKKGEEEISKEDRKTIESKLKTLLKKTNDFITENK